MEAGELAELVEPGRDGGRALLHAGHGHRRHPEVGLGQGRRSVLIAIENAKAFDHGATKC